MEASTQATVLYHGFISTYKDLTVYVACVCSILGVVLLLSIVFFALEKFGFLNRKRNRNRKSYNGGTTANPFHDVTNTHYDASMSSMTHNPYTSSGSFIKQNSNAISSNLYAEAYSSTRNVGAARHGKPKTRAKYVDDVITAETTGSTEGNGAPHLSQGGIAVAYERPIPVKKKKVLPSLFVPYKRNKKQNRTQEETRSNKKVAMPTEQHNQIEDQNQLSFTAVAVDRFDPLAALKEAEKQREEEERNKKKRIVSLKDEIVPKVKKVDKSFVIGYENPKVAAKQRRERERLEEEKIKLEQERKKKRRVISYTSDD
nr:uncharacterized protein LOC100176970 [Ciona intestinalis]|eukprot:XP_002125426.1 uncharacterized protein LOC100176970 [Ciona intestinalis]